MKHYSEGGTEMGALMQRMVDEVHTTLAEATIAVVASSREKPSKPMSLGPPGKVAKSQGIDLVLVYDETVAADMGKAQLAAWVDNALCGYQGRESETKAGDVVTVYQRVEPILVYPECIERRGAVLAQHKAVYEAFPQMELPLEVVA